MDALVQYYQDLLDPEKFRQDKFSTRVFRNILEICLSVQDDTTFHRALLCLVDTIQENSPSWKIFYEQALTRLIEAYVKGAPSLPETTTRHVNDYQ